MKHICGIVVNVIYNCIPYNCSCNGYSWRHIQCATWHQEIRNFFGPIVWYHMVVKGQSNKARSPGKPMLGCLAMENQKGHIQSNSSLEFCLA